MTHQISFFGFFLEVERSKSLILFQIQNPSVASIIYPESTQKRKAHKKYTIQKGSTLQDKKLMNSKSESIYNQSQSQSTVQDTIGYEAWWYDYRVPRGGVHWLPFYERYWDSDPTISGLNSF